MVVTSPIRILVVEDHLVTRLGLTMVLDEVPNLKVVGEAEDGVDCLQKVDQLNPDIVLLDIGLPLIDGIECATRLKKACSKSRIIMRSSHEELSVIFSALSTGADGYSSKDNPDTVLIDAINTVASGDFWLDPRIAAKLITSLGKYKNKSPVNADDHKLTNEEWELLYSIANNTNQRLSANLPELMKKIGTMGGN